MRHLQPSNRTRFGSGPVNASRSLRTRVVVLDRYGIPERYVSRAIRADGTVAYAGTRHTVATLYGYDGAIQPNNGPLNHR